MASGDTWGGAERVLTQLVGGFSGQVSLDIEALLFNEGRLAQALRALGTKVHVIPESQHSVLGLILATRRRLASARVDVVHAHRYKEILIGALALAPRSRGLVATVHGLEPHAQLTRTERVRVWGTLAAARLLNARFTAVSTELTQRLQRALGRRAVIKIPNPVPVVQYLEMPDLRRRFGWSASLAVVGFVGRLEQVKGPDRFVDLAEDYCGDAGFVVIGTGSLERELRERVARQRLEGRVAFVGEVSEASCYLRQLDVLALPSRHEGTPMILLEAAACEIPVIAFDVGGVREVLDGGPAEWLIKAGEMDSFGGAIATLLQNRQHAKSEAVRWAASVQARFSSRLVMSAYRAVYQAVAAGSS